MSKKTGFFFVIFIISVILLLDGIRSTMPYLRPSFYEEDMLGFIIIKSSYMVMGYIGVIISGGQITVDNKKIDC